MSVDLETGDVGAVLQELRTDYPEVYEVIYESIVNRRDMHDIRRASLARRMRTQLRARPAAGALVDEFAAALRRGVS